jgi:hypothetical protein
MLDTSWPGWGIEQSCISAAAGLLGVFAGTFMTNRNQAKQRQLGARLSKVLVDSDSGAFDWRKPELVIEYAA